MTLNLSSISLYPATSTQVVRQRERTFVHWNRGLTLEDYLKRAEVVDIHEHAINGKLTTWVLAPRSHPETLDFFCGCETFRRPGIIFDHSLAEAKETIAYGVAAVYCPPEHRGKGYASHMMRLLHYVLASSESLPPFPLEWGTPPVIPANILPGSFSVLYSDIGPNFYQLCGPGNSGAGWTVRGHSQTVWQTKLFERRTDQLRWLSIEDCIRVWQDDVIYVKQQVACKSQNWGSCAFLPSSGVAAFQIRRASFFLPGLPGVPIPQKWGVEIEGLSGPTYATWITNSTGPQHVALLVTRIRATPNTFSLLLSAIMEAATENKCGSIEIWSLDPALSDEARKLGGVEVEREHNLPSLAWYGPGDPDKVEFMFNERFAYC